MSIREYPSNDPRNRSNRRPPTRRKPRPASSTGGRVYPPNDPRSRDDARGAQARLASARELAARANVETAMPTRHEQWMFTPDDGGQPTWFRAPSEAAARNYCARRHLTRGTLTRGVPVDELDGGEKRNPVAKAKTPKKRKAAR